MPKKLLGNQEVNFKNLHSIFCWIPILLKAMTLFSAGAGHHKLTLCNLCTNAEGKAKQVNFKRKRRILVANVFFKIKNRKKIVKITFKLHKLEE